MTRLIKKYKNRRLYDTELSQYITVEELQQYVINGIIFRVEDAQSNKDITSTVLLQIFVEMENTATQFLSADMLRQLILAHHPLNNSFKEMLQQVFKTMDQTGKTNPFLQDYQKMSEAWQENAGVMLTKWKELFKS